MCENTIICNFQFLNLPKGDAQDAIRRQTREEFRRSGPPRCRARRLPRNRCRRRQNINR